MLSLRPLVRPIQGWISTLKYDPALLIEMATHCLQYRQRVGVGEQDLKCVPSHDDQVEAPWRTEILGWSLDPLHLVGVTLAFGNSQHRRCWIDARHMMTMFSKCTAKRSCATTKVEHAVWPRTGQRQIELAVAFQ